MSLVMSVISEAKRKFKKFRLSPIHIFLFHQVSPTFDNTTMKESDWTEINQFKRNIERLKQQYTFISLAAAFEKIKKDVFRFKRYAVLTSDDGWISLMNILPWLQEQGIPVTLFLNPGYFDGKSFRDKPTERYLTEKDVDYLDNHFPSISFGSHGLYHRAATAQDLDEFYRQVTASIESLSRFHNYIPFFAYPYGRHNSGQDTVLSKLGLVPVLIDKYYNLNDTSVLHRELLDGKVVQ